MSGSDLSDREWCEHERIFESETGTSFSLLLVFVPLMTLFVCMGFAASQGWLRLVFGYLLFSCVGVALRLAYPRIDRFFRGS